ncbi:MAG: tRNA (N6-isopentenyl adenosine(37)-C2)-methylthiotransferase MiaB [Kiritimatiellia bacterium]|jgi:tRNA-2-methylthio-N6-dimethylallyladenosine synthase
MSKPTFSIRTYGCQMNERDSDVLASRLVACGYRPAEDEKSADIVIVNSCSVRKKAEDKALGKIGLLCAERRDRPGLVVGLMGCMAQRLGADVFKRVPGLSFSVGTRAAVKIPEFLARIQSGEDNLCEIGVFDDEDACERLHASQSPAEPPGAMSPGVSAFVTILLGCNRRCAYCIVPDVRGHEHSRQPDEILPEIRELVAAGVRDITLLGQSVMNYGRRDFQWPAHIPSPLGFTEPLPRLFELVAREVPELARIRFTSSHPSGVTDELVRALRDVRGVCPHVHMAMQSGSDRVLKAMRRGYDAAGYLAAVARLRAAVPDIAITTDVIVGFPGETEADFEDTRRVMDEAGFDNAFIFKYSPRPGTPAAEMEDDVSEEEKMRRNQVLLEDQDVRGLAINERVVGTTTEVLVEGPSLRNATRWSGRNPQDKIVVFTPTPTIAPGDLVSIRVTKARPQTLFGDVRVK